MHCITTPMVGYAPALPHLSAPAYRIELTGVLHEHGKVFVAIADERHNWLVECRPKDLASFQRFRRRVEAELSISIDHESQDDPRFTVRRDAWDRAVRIATRRGAAA